MVFLNEDNYMFLAENQIGHCLLLVNAYAKHSSIDLDPEGEKGNEAFLTGIFLDVPHSLCLLLALMVTKKLSDRKLSESDLPLYEH